MLFLSNFLKHKSRKFFNHRNRLNKVSRVSKMSKLFRLIYNFSLFIYNLLKNLQTKRKMATPALKDLPKVDDDLKSQLEGFSANKLSHTETQEKNLLPSAEGKLLIRNSVLF